MNQPSNLTPGFFEQSIQPDLNRINLIETQVDNSWNKVGKNYKEYSLSENIKITKKSRNVVYDMLRGIQEPGVFSMLFFSCENIAEIQKLIKYNVYKQGKFRIDNQAEQEILIIMRAIYLQFAKIPSQQEYYTQEIARLNQMVTERAIRTILSEITQQQKYLYDIANPVYIKSYGINDTITGKDIRDTSDIIFAKTTNFM
jgi:Family of unknown function (DUF5761)